MPRPIHFEIPADNPERAIKFYETAFGWTFQKWAGPMDYWLIKTGDASEPGINGGMIRRIGATPVDGQAVNAYVCTVSVSAIDETIAKVVPAGGVIAVPKMPIPGIGRGSFWGRAWRGSRRIAMGN